MKPSPYLEILRMDAKDLLRNMASLPLVFVPPLLAWLMRAFVAKGAPAEFMMPMWVVYAQVMTGLMFMTFGIAEDKEKKTLEALFLVPMPVGRILLAKSLFAYIVTIIVEALVIFPNGVWTGDVWAVALAALIGPAIFVEMGLILGLLSPNYKASGTYSVPVMLILFLGPMIGGAVKALQPIVKWLPSTPLGDMVASGMRGAGAEELGARLAVLAVWAVALAIGIKFAVEWQRR